MGMGTAASLAKFVQKGTVAQRPVDAQTSKAATSEVGELVTQFFGERKPGKFALVATSSLAPSKSNPRKAFAKEELAELARSVQSEGILQPLLVRPDPHGTQFGTQLYPYEIVTGERRWRAAQLAGLERVPCIVREMTDSEALDAQIAENLQRQDITPLEEAAAYRARLKAAGDAGQKMSVDQLAERIGKSRRYVYDKLQLLDLGEAATKALERGDISSAYASEMVRLKPEILQEKAIAAIADGAVASVKQLREWIGEERRESANDDGVKLKAVQHATREQLETWAKICCAGSICYQGRVKGLLYVDHNRKLKLAEAEEMSFGIGGFYAVTATVSSGREGVIQVSLERVVRRSEWKARTFTYTTKPVEKDGHLEYKAIRAKCAGRQWVFTGDRSQIRAAGATASPSVKNGFRREEWSATAIKREMRDAIEERFGAVFRIARIAQARKRGEWLAVIVQTAKVQASAKRRKR